MRLDDFTRALSAARSFDSQRVCMASEKRMIGR
jgi:hypothetical protein